MKRRDFVNLVGVSSVVPLAIAACNSQRRGTSALRSPRSDGFQAVGTLSDLNAQGQLLVEGTAVGNVLVIPDPADNAQILAINSTCPHAGCTVDWQADQTAFACPCHGSRFATDGEVLRGPATLSLPTYVTQVEGDTVLVKVS